MRRALTAMQPMSEPGGVAARDTSTGLCRSVFGRQLLSEPIFPLLAIHFRIWQLAETGIAQIAPAHQ